MNLVHLIRAVAGNEPPRTSVNEFTFLCRKIAVVFLRKKVSLGRLYPETFGVSIDDLALDCIADLFLQDDHGTLLQISAYFNGISLEKTTDEELLGHIRRLVFAKVNQGIFRAYNEVDPSLGKILRNIKLAIQSLEQFSTVDRFGELSITPCLCDTLEHLPPMDRGQLEHCLHEIASGSENIPSLLSKLARALREQSSHSRIVPLMSIAFAVRSLYSGPADNSAGETSPEDSFTAHDSQNIIREACNGIKAEMKTQYVSKKKVEPVVYEHYFDVIEQNLVARIVQQDGEMFSFFDRLQALMPELTKEEYGRDHKSRVEYLGRLTYDRAISELRKNF